MIKNLSITFAAIMACIIFTAILTAFFPSQHLLVIAINLGAVGLVICGIILIVALIVDRYKDYKKEGDDYKKY